MISVIARSAADGKPRLYAVHYRLVVRPLADRSLAVVHDRLAIRVVLSTSSLTTSCDLKHGIARLDCRSALPPSELSQALWCLGMQLVRGATVSSVLPGISWWRRLARAIGGRLLERKTPLVLPAGKLP